MNKNKFYTIGLIAGSLFATSCDDRVDCGCDCNMPVFEKWEVLNPNETKNEDGTVSSGKAIVVWGKNLSDITEISFGGMNAELQPAFMEDNKIKENNVENKPKSNRFKEGFKQFFSKENWTKDKVIKNLKKYIVLTI